MIEAAQLDIFIPLQRSKHFPEWALLAREHQFDVAKPGGVRAFAYWLRENGRAPGGLSDEALTVLVAVMEDYERGHAPRGGRPRLGTGSRPSPGNPRVDALFPSA